VVRGRQKLEVSGENTESLIIAGGGGVSFQGRVTIAGPNQPELDRIGIFLFGIDEDKSFGAGGQVKKDGTFELKSVSDGDYAILVEGLEKNGRQVGAARGGGTRRQGTATGGRQVLVSRFAS